MSKIRLVIFDIDGTLYSSKEYEIELGRIIVELIGEILKISFEEARHRLEKEKRLWLTVSSSLPRLGIDRRYFYSLLAERVNPSRYINPNPSIIEHIKFLRSRDVKVAVHTNSDTLLADKVLRAIGLKLGDFDVVMTIDSAEPKPDPDGYIKIINRVGVGPEETIYLGDRVLVELKTAKMLGMITVLVGRKIKRSVWVDYVVDNINDALELVKKLVEKDYDG